ncbi:hypothetical protein KPB05_37405 [Burkholderia gladioli]|uniref:TraK family protein n=1 Tax=Burkholderia gladioli TaxID=28095 RepID=UPI00285C9C08|nr:TraK family protein [Burkholderia gladioli]MDR8093137.1 hypothetical protein [Burkholderia gladioli]
MAKSLSERIAERARTQKAPGRGGKNRATFLALRQDIAKALADGWSARAVWETLKEEGKIDFSYDPFTKYVKQLIEQPSTQPQAPAPGAATSTATQSPPAAQQIPIATRIPAPTPPAADQNSAQATPNSTDRRHERRSQEPGFRLTTTSKQDIV